MTWEWVIQALVWLGLFSVAVGAIFSTRTRWVKSRPLGKYVAYSVVAHAILLAIFYGTQLNYPLGDYGPGYGTISVRLSALSGDGGSDNSSDDPLNSSDEVVDVDNSPQSPTVSESNVPPNELPETQNVEAPPLIQRSPKTIAVAEANLVPPLMERPKRAPADAIHVPDVKSPTDLVVVDSSSEPIARSDAAPAAPAGSTSAKQSTAGTSGENQSSDSVDSVPLVYRNRIADDHSFLALRFGGGADTESAVKAALVWLARNQSDDGRWDADAFGAGREARIHGHDRKGAGAKADTGITALAILAFLGANHSHLHGDYPETVQHGIEFLLRSQRADGCMAGQAEFFAAMYCHGMSLLAIGEAYTLTKDERLRPYLERGVQYTLNSQSSSSGGWRYQPGDPGDMSQFGWQVLALKSAEAGGLPIPEKSRRGMSRFLDSVTSGRHQGLASYRAGERVSSTMTAEAIVCRVFMDEYSELQGREAAEFLRRDLPRAGQENLYYWYYGSLAMFQVQGDDWTAWNEALKARLLSKQRRGGTLEGSWDPDSIWGQYGGRVFSTSLAALCLEVYYRYLPIYQVADRQETRRAARKQELR